MGSYLAYNPPYPDARVLGIDKASYWHINEYGYLVTDQNGNDPITMRADRTAGGGFIFGSDAVETDYPLIVSATPTPGGLLSCVDQAYPDNAYFYHQTNYLAMPLSDVLIGSLDYITSHVNPEDSTLLTKLQFKCV